LFVLAGSGTIDGAELTLHSAIQLDPGKQGCIVGKEMLELLVFGLPPIVTAELAASTKAMMQPA
jgi:hypothetical protein